MRPLAAVFAALVRGDGLLVFSEAFEFIFKEGLESCLSLETCQEGRSHQLAQR